MINVTYLVIVFNPVRSVGGPVLGIAANTRVLLECLCNDNDKTNFT